MKPRSFGTVIERYLFMFVLGVVTLALLWNSVSYATTDSPVDRIDNPIEHSESFSFVVWGHPKSGDGKPALHFEEILDRITELKADFLVVTGDVINGMWGKHPDPDFIRGDWERFDAGLKKLEIPTYRLPGNHDVHNFVTRDIYLERYPMVPFAFTYKGSRFILLDTVGIDQRTQDGHPDWYPQKLPFNDVQLQFIRHEIEGQENYSHVFFFMHHVHGWREPNGYWWKDVHPMLKGGKTRAVFSGTPGNPAYKYDYIEQDNIHYINSCTVRAVHSINHYKNQMKLGDRDHDALNHQPDNLQFVRVEGDKFKIQTIVVGEWNTKTLSSRFWAKVKKPLGLRQNLKYHLREGFKAFRRVSVGNLIWGGAGLTVGLLIAVFWQRRHP